MKKIKFHRYQKKEDLIQVELPKNAIAFREPKSFIMINVVSFLYIIPLILIIVWINHQREVYYPFNLTGILLSFLCIIPHEILHAVCFPKEDMKHIYYAPKYMLMFVLCNAAISKKRFIILSLLPNIVFGLLPYMAWLILPLNTSYSQTLLSFSVLNLLAGAGDYMNVVNAMLQMPKNSIQILSGMHSYWCMPEDF